VIPDRSATRRIRSRYLEALDAIPLPVGYNDPPDKALPIDLAGLPVLATDDIDDRAVRYSLVVGQTRFRLTFKEIEPALIGHITNLDTPEPRLIVAEPLHTEWARTNEPALIEHAMRAWHEQTRTCER
jgi:hypothetical protein